MRIDFDLVEVEFHARMVTWQKINLIDFVQFMVVKNLYIIMVEQVKIDLVAIIANRHNEGTFEVEGFDFLMEG